VSSAWQSNTQHMMLDILGGSRLGVLPKKGNGVSRLSGKAG
jgi:hypothetical protein